MMKKNKLNNDAMRVKAEENRIRAQFIARVVYDLTAKELTLERMANVSCALDLDIGISLVPQANQEGNQK